MMAGQMIGTISDSSHLHGVLERLASLGLRLNRLSPREPENKGPSRQRPNPRRADD